MSQICTKNTFEIRLSILKVLAYFKIFEHPLKLREIAALCNISVQETEQNLSFLIEDEMIFDFEQYYSTSRNVAQYSGLRKVKEAEAEKYFIKLKKYAKLLATFPFVRGIAVSGSLSKGVMNPDGDIDYFIITKPGRLWICRTLMILFKKLFLFNSKRYFCVNYFVDENNLQIRDKNIFTATEFVHLIPVFEHSCILNVFLFQNNWVHKYYPNLPDWNRNYLVQCNIKLKNAFELLLKTSVFNPLEKLCHHITLYYWRKKFPNFKKEKFHLTMRSTKGISKHHPSDFQTKVLRAFQIEMNEINSYLTVSEL
ncbi:MAG TPA: nucleotidyltransferase domain-containing protein [Bacteroidia bacterium]|nr:nucleotidyltransferase domain-containing protein [Bacteroidia bacterium]